jgi:hypothetical protein
MMRDIAGLRQGAIRMCASAYSETVMERSGGDQRQMTAVVTAQKRPHKRGQ